MNCDIATAVAFTGHRTYNGSADAELRTLIVRAYEQGYRLFLSGMAVGFDLTAAETVLSLRTECPEIGLVCIVPFPGQADHFSARDLERYEQVLRAAGLVSCLSEVYSPVCYMRRNDYLVENASLLIAYYDGSDSGTGYTVRRARKLGIEVINLYPDPQLSLPGF